jgi:hypothetical protein
MAGRLMKLLFRPGWRLRCVDPPLGWLKVRDEQPPVVEFRLQMTCYLTSQWAGPVRVKELQLRVIAGEREFLVPWSASADPQDEPFGDTPEYSVSSAAPHHAFVDFASDAPDLIALVETATEPIPVFIEGLFNAAFEFRPIASVDFEVDQPVLRGEVWRKVKTGRKLIG